MSKTDLPFRFCKIGFRNTLFIFGRKNGRLFCLFVCVFVAALSDFGLLFKIEALIELRKMLIRKKLFHVRFAWIWELLNPKDKLFFQNKVQRVLYKLVLVTYPLDHSQRIYSPSNFRFIQKTKKIKIVPITIIILPKINLERLELLRP